MADSRNPPLTGALVYFGLCLALSWLTVLALQGIVRGEHEPLITRLLAASLLYVVTMGWQPVAAASIARRFCGVAPLPSDEHARTKRAHFVAAVVVPTILAVAAAVVTLTLADLGLINDAARVNAEPELSSSTATWSVIPALFVAFLATILLLFSQAFAEEVGWRGYFMPYLIRRFGFAGGLLWHGVLWGLWYAPLLIVASSALRLGSLRAAAFVVTCSLLGAIFGWLRIISGSAIPPAIANATLTLLAGLPFVLVGVETSHRGAIYAPAGWIPLVIAAVVVILIRTRFAPNRS